MTKLSLEEFENGIKLYQDETLYKFTSDAIRLAKFCKLKPTDNVLDMCAGSGVVGLYAYSINPCNKIYFNDIQPAMCELLNKNIQLNSLQNKCKILCKDLKNLELIDFDKKLDIILCNPPYFKLNGKIKSDINKAICRHEIATDLKTIVQTASKLIKCKGKFYLVIPSNRLCECVIILSKNGFEVKNVEIYHTRNCATVCVIEGVKDAKSGVNIKVIKENL